MSNSSRPQTPSSQSKDSYTKSRTPPARTNSSQPSLPRKNYHRFLSDTTKSWSSSNADDELDQLNVDEDEDEFGLPSITSNRSKSYKQGYGGYRSSDVSRNNNQVDGVKPSSNLKFASGDIAEERGLPMYPTAKQAQGKILRPQYKEILRGRLYSSPFTRLNMLILS